MQEKEKILMFYCKYEWLKPAFVSTDLLPSQKKIK